MFTVSIEKTRHRQTCIRIRRSLECLRSKRCSVNSRRTFSTSQRSSAVPSSGSNSHTCRPRKLLTDRSHGLLPSDTFSLHIRASGSRKKWPISRDLVVHCAYVLSFIEGTPASCTRQLLPDTVAVGASNG